MSTSEKARQMVTESLLFKIESCDRLLDKTNEDKVFERLFKTKLSLLTRLEDLVLCTQTT